MHRQETPNTVDKVSMWGAEFATLPKVIAFFKKLNSPDRSYNVTRCTTSKKPVVNVCIFSYNIETVSFGCCIVHWACVGLAYTILYHKSHCQFAWRPILTLYNLLSNDINNYVDH